MSNKNETMFKVILQHLFDFSQFEIINHPFDVSKISVIQPDHTVHFDSYEQMFNYIYNDKYVGQLSNDVSVYGQFVMSGLDGEEVVLQVIFPTSNTCSVAVTGGLTLTDATTIQKLATHLEGLSTCLADEM